MEWQVLHPGERCPEVKDPNMGVRRLKPLGSLEKMTSKREFKSFAVREGPDVYSCLSGIIHGNSLNIKCRLRSRASVISRVMHVPLTTATRWMVL